MPQIGPFEIMVVAVVALIVFGPEKLPEIAHRIGKALADFRQVVDEAKGEFQSGLNFDDDDLDHPMNESLDQSAESPDPRDQFDDTMDFTDVPDRPPSSVDPEAPTQQPASSFTAIPNSLEPPRQEPHDV
jgi:sec-independent protein translocase protein TatB